MSNSFPTIRPVLIAVLACLTVGCNRSDRVPVSGRITLDGQPLAGAFVSVQPTTGMNPGAGAYGRTDADGVYELRSMIDDQLGTVVGPHQVSVTTSIPEAPNSDRMSVERLPTRYHMKSQLSLTVPEGGTTAAHFDLTSRP